MTRDIMKEIFTTSSLEELISSIPEETKDSLDLTTCNFRFNTDYNFVIIEGPVSVIDTLKRSIPFFRDALAKMRALEKEKELEEIQKEIEKYRALESSAT